MTDIAKLTDAQRAALEERTAELMRETGMFEGHARMQAAIELGLSKGDVIYEGEES
ncbi:MAG TPA: hypothetical protein VIM33_16315 [Gaiellaceae bacterium]|jgi:hypothetical protein